MKTPLLVLSLLASGTLAAQEFSIHEISERTVRVQWSLHPAAPSTVLVPFTSTEKVRVREFKKQEEVRAGQLRIAITPQPLTVSVRR